MFFKRAVDEFTALKLLNFFNTEALLQDCLNLASL